MLGRPQVSQVAPIGCELPAKPLWLCGSVTGQLTSEELIRGQADCGPSSLRGDRCGAATTRDLGRSSVHLSELSRTTEQRTRRRHVARQPNDGRPQKGSCTRPASSAQDVRRGSETHFRCAEGPVGKAEGAGWRRNEEEVTTRDILTSRSCVTATCRGLSRCWKLSSACYWSSSAWPSWWRCAIATCVGFEGV